VFALGFKERTDKKDALVLASSLTGFKVEWMNAVRGDEVPDKALPSVSLSSQEKAISDQRIGVGLGTQKWNSRMLEGSYEYHF